MRTDSPEGNIVSDGCSNSGISHPPRCRELERAQSLANLFGPPPHSFAVAVANLMADHHNSNGQISANGLSQILRLLKAPSFLAHLYYATRSYYPDMWQKELISKPADLVKCYDARTLAVVTALSYLYKRARRLCHPEEWGYISHLVHVHADVGMQLGMTFPDITTSSALLGGAVVFTALAAFQAEDPTGFKQYRRSLKHTNLFSPVLEYQRWGCSAHQIAACLMTTMGFRSDYSVAFCQGFDSTDLSVELLDQEAARFRHIRAYLEAVHCDTPLNLPNPDETIEVEILLKEAKELRNSHKDDTPHWLSCGKDDISPSKLSELNGVRWDRAAAVLRKLGHTVNYEVENEEGENGE